MKWIKALKLAVPVWLLICAVMAAVNYTADKQTPVGYLIIALAVAYPLTAFILKETAEDFSKWREAFGSRREK